MIYGEYLFYSPGALGQGVEGGLETRDKVSHGEFHTYVTDPP